MKTGWFRRFGMLGIWLAGASAVPAGTNFLASLQAGEVLQGSGNAQGALTEYSSALSQAANATERALAPAKKATVFAYITKDYAAAKEAAQGALAMSNALPVARVTALQILAECQMKAEGDNVAAAKTLEEALMLTGMDWAKPTLLLMLGDAYRFSGQYTMALSNLQELQDLTDADIGTKALGWLNTAFIYQYGLKDKDKDKARSAYAAAVRLKPDLQAEVDRHLAELPP